MKARKRVISPEEVYKKLYPEAYDKGVIPIGYTLREIRLQTAHSSIAPHEVDLTTHIGSIKMNLPILSAAMDTVSGPHMAKALHE